MKLIEKVFLLVLVVAMFFSLNSVSATNQGMKLYRNTDYKFSIEIPEYMKYGIPRNPSVKMYAGSGEFDIMISVQSFPELQFSNDFVLNELATEQKNLYRNMRVPILESYIVDLPRYRVLYSAYDITYNPSTNPFKMTQYTFQFIQHWKYYCISYFVVRGKENLYQETIRDSVDSFIDETVLY